MVVLVIISGNELILGITKLNTIFMILLFELEQHMNLCSRVGCYCINQSLRVSMFHRLQLFENHVHIRSYEYKYL